MSVTYTTAHGNAGSLNPWARPGIELVPLWMLWQICFHWATIGTLLFLYYKEDERQKWESNLETMIPGVLFFHSLQQYKCPLDKCHNQTTRNRWETHGSIVRRLSCVTFGNWFNLLEPQFPQWSNRKVNIFLVYLIDLLWGLTEMQTMKEIWNFQLPCKCKAVL